MKKGIYSFLIYVLILVLCYSSTATAEQKYVIGDEDVLQISGWGSPELTVQVPVSPDGMISIPLAGDVRSARLKPQELKASLEKELMKYVTAPT